ncbi:hypothetical protein BDQ17DRAFT_1537009 [Cyathus striatus]|nr:hypothetical protein BDQ17DRAFT_1537009 [Cyathus striatus]
MSILAFLKLVCVLWYPLSFSFARMSPEIFISMCPLPQPHQTLSLPPEIVHEIASHVRDRNTLLSCSVVCRAWMNIVRPILFNKLTLSTSTARRLKIRLGTNDSFSLPNHVKQLHLDDTAISTGPCQSGEAEQAMVAALVRLFAFTGNCPSMLLQRKYCPWSRLIVGFNHITHLELSSVEFYTFSDATRLIHSFPLLHTLSMEYLDWKWPSSDNMNWSLPDTAQIKLLNLDDKNATEISRWLISQRNSVSIQKLCFETHQLSHNRSVCRLVDAFGNTFQELCFSMTFNNLAPTPDNFKESVGVNHCHQLKHLHLDNIILARQSRFVSLWIPVVLSQVESQVLTKVTMTILLQRNELNLASSITPWKNIDRILCQADKYPSLEAVCVKVKTEENHADVDRFIKQKLPGVVERGKLEVAFLK